MSDRGRAEGVRPDEVLVLRVTKDGSTADVLQDIAEGIRVAQRG